MIANLIGKLSMKWVLIAAGVLVASNVSTCTALKFAKDDVREAEQDLADEIASCNVDKLQADLDAAHIVIASNEKAYKEELAERDRVAKINSNALRASQEASVQAESTLAKHELTIQQLQLEAEEYEIPDSMAALNAFVPVRSLEWVCVQGQGIDPSDRDAGASAETICRNSLGLAGAEPAFSHFSGITYGGALTRWGQDRKSLIECNADKAAIREIQGQVIDGD